MAIVPQSKPKAPYDTLAAIVRKAGIRDGFAIVGVRGYYFRTMGDPNRNDRGIYDDALFVVTPNVFAAFNANTDPSVYRKGIAVLRPGLYEYKVGIHGLSKPANRRYTALVQAGKVTVDRDGTGPDTGFFGINIHKGGPRSTSSLGCQTIYPAQWPSFIELVKSELKRAGRTTVPYLLVEGPIN